jgi:anti-sigma regulatory factor (Ser/Thr protein kinase)
MHRTAIDEMRRSMDDVHLVVPAASDFLRVVRLAAADAASRAGLDCEDVEDFRIGVDELSHAVMAATDHDLHICFRVGDHHVVARGTARSRGGSVPPAMTQMSRTIVSGLSDAFQFSGSKSEITFVLVKSTGRASADLS